MDKFKMVRILLIWVVAAVFVVPHSVSASITNCGPVATGFMLEWVSDGQAVVTWSPNLETVPFTELSGTLLAGQESYTDTVHGADNQGFYRVEIEAPGVMMLIPAGGFQMGDTFAEGDGDELPLHDVSISGFYMDKYEVTKALWDEVYSWAVSHGYSFDRTGSGKAFTHPVHLVNWYDCVKWCNARSEMDGKTPCYYVGGNVYRTGQSTPDCTWSANGYRLPTEAEWEKAARGGLTHQRFPWGDTISHSEANYRSSDSFSYDVSSSRGYHPSYDDGTMPYTSPVGSFSANGYGLCDMAGNVWEWCWDVYDSSYYETSPPLDPRGPTSGALRSIRGGSWSIEPNYNTAADRIRDLPGGGSNSVGFRTVRSAE